jgi:acetylornithine deacetylase/succinyl-diaminopimelate desuccinylase-like protein
MIKGGFDITQVPDTCTIKCDCRTLPGQNTELVLKDINRVILKLKEKDPELNTDIAIINEARPWFIDPKAPIVEAMLQAIEEVTGNKIPVSGVPSTSDARFLMLDLNIPVCKFVFGDVLGRRKYVDEYQGIDRYIDTIKVYSTLMMNLLKNDIL